MYLLSLGRNLSVTSNVLSLDSKHFVNRSVTDVSLTMEKKEDVVQSKEEQASAKRQRTQARRSFNRALKEVNEALISLTLESEREVMDAFEGLKEARRDLLAKHDQFALTLDSNAEDDNEADEYLTEPENSFKDTRKQVHKFLDNVMKERSAHEKEVEKEKMEAEKELIKAEITKNIQRLKNIRAAEASSFQLEYKRITEIDECDTNGSVIKEMDEQLKENFSRLKEANVKLIENLSEMDAATEINWIIQFQQMYQDGAKIINQLKKNPEISIEGKSKSSKGSLMKLHKISLPSFSNKMREYPKFKADFIKYIIPNIEDSDSASYILASCLSGEALEKVRNVDDDIAKMWQRLDEIYGDASKVTDLILNEIKRIQPISEGDNKGFIELVDVVEMGYRDLTRLNIEHEMSNSHTVSLIEEKLPIGLKLKWSKKVKCEGSSVVSTEKFPHLLNFLLERKRIIEYAYAELRSTEEENSQGWSYHVEQEKKAGKNDNDKSKSTKCLFHPQGIHGTTECRYFLGKEPQERLKLVTDQNACFVCLKKNHHSNNCKNKKACGSYDCDRFHHPLLHDAQFAEGTISLASSNIHNTPNCILQIMPVNVQNNPGNPLTVLWDSGASISLITTEKAKELKLRGKATHLTLIKVGGTSESIPSFEYEIPLKQLDGRVMTIKAFGIQHISSEIKEIKLDHLKHLFEELSTIKRPSGHVDLLIGFNYAGIHPVMKKAHGNLLLMENCFGACLGGTHPKLNEATVNHIDATIYHVTQGHSVTLDNFIDTENLGISCSPSCGGCKCGQCALGSKQFTIKEEKELNMMEANLQHKGDHWETSYPWIKDPNTLENNLNAAKAILRSTEKRLQQNPVLRKMYEDQIQDLLLRKVAVKVDDDEIARYTGPIHYLSHHEVIKEESKSTPCRIVFNASAKYKGQTLNEFWAKGPDLLNNLLGVLLRFREQQFAMVGDIRKMYHAIKLKPGLDQHTHRFLWRNAHEATTSTYMLTSVSFGDRPSGTIAALALRKTAEMGKEKFPKAADVVLNSTYVDDVIDSFPEDEETTEISKDVSELIKPGGFEIKEWIISNNLKASLREPSIESEPSSNVISQLNTFEQTEEGSLHLDESCRDKNNQGIDFNNTNANSEPTIDGKVLGMIWDKESDSFYFKVKLNFSQKKRKKRIDPDINQNDIKHILPEQVTKRQILSQVNGFYDPLGLASPVIIQAKIMMAQLWKIDGLEWDDSIPDIEYRKWIDFFYKLFEMEKLTFNRCLKPIDAIGDPYCITFSDASEEAYGAVTYVRWRLPNGTFESRLVAAKSKVKPRNKVTIVRMELNAAVVASRLQDFICKHMRYKFDKKYLFVDSAIVHAMVKKESYGFNTYVAVRVGEIQTNTNPTDWHWIDSTNNIADWITRPKSPADIDDKSPWQIGPSFLRKPEEEWPTLQSPTPTNLPEQKQEASILLTQCKDETLLSRMDINRFSKLETLIGTTTRILDLYKRYKTENTDFNPRQLATILWIKEAQAQLEKKMKDCSLIKLCPRYENEVIVVGGRVERWNEASWNRQTFILLPSEHRLSWLIAEWEHRRSGHIGISSTIAKTRSVYWIIGIRKLVKKMISSCYRCKFRLKNMACQVMSPLPEERLKPAPAFHTTGIDYFGPFKLKGEVQKRTHGKGYGVIFTCVISRAVYLDISCDYSTEAFMQVLRRFASFRGWPGKIISDQGTQLVGASNELKAIVASIDKHQVQQFCSEKNVVWEFTTADAPWMNGVTESLVKSAKRAIESALGSQILTFSQLLTVFFEAAELVNERPIGQHPTDPTDGAYLCPNDLLLGRSSNTVPQGPFQAGKNTKLFFFLQQIVDNFWQKWTRDFFPSLVVEPKWHFSRRNVSTNDVVLIKDNDSIRGEWKLGRVTKILDSKDGRVRKVQVVYKNNDEKGLAKHFITIDRAVHNLVVIVPAEEQQH